MLDKKLSKLHPRENTQIEFANSINVVGTPNTPNPFNSRTTIRYEVAEEDRIDLHVYSVSGHRIRTMVSARHRAGSYSVLWDSRDDEGRPVGSDVYIYSLSVGRFRSTRKMVLLR